MATVLRDVVRVVDRELEMVVELGEPNLITFLRDGVVISHGHHIADCDPQPTSTEEAVRWMILQIECARACVRIGMGAILKEMSER